MDPIFVQDAPTRGYSYAGILLADKLITFPGTLQGQRRKQIVISNADAGNVIRVRFQSRPDLANPSAVTTDSVAPSSTLANQFSAVYVRPFTSITLFTDADVTLSSARNIEFCVGEIFYQPQ